MSLASLLFVLIIFSLNDSTVSHRYSTTSTLFIIFGSIPGMRHRRHLGKLITSPVKKAHAASRTRESPTQL